MRVSVVETNCSTGKTATIVGFARDGAQLQGANWCLIKLHWK